MTPEQAIRAVTAEDLPEDDRIAAAHGLGRAIEQGDYAAWERVRPVIESESAAARVRSALVWVFAEKADERIAGEMLSMAIGWSEEIEAQRAEAGEEADEAWQSAAAATLLTNFLYRLPDTPLGEFVPADERALGLVESVALRGPRRPGGRAVQHILLESEAPPELVSAVATKLIVENAASGGGSIAGLVTPEDAQRLRRALEESGATAETMHWNAMMALGYVGDAESRELFLAKKRVMDETDPKQGQMIRYYLWQIDVQSPPEGLLEHIAQPTDRTVPHNRDWAMRRAVERGLPRDDIRRAIFAFAKTVEPERRKDARGRWQTVWPELYGTKATAVDLGLMGREELPHIPYSDVKPTP